MNLLTIHIRACELQKLSDNFFSIGQYQIVNSLEQIIIDCEDIIKRGHSLDENELNERFLCNTQMLKDLSKLMREMAESITKQNT